MVSLNGLYDKFDKYFVAIDCIIFGFDEQGLKILLIKRGFEPEKGKWSLMGGFLAANESIESGAARILEQLTGLKSVFLEQLFCYGDVRRDPEARTISIAYYALIKIDTYNKDTVKAFNASWCSVDKMPDLIFDHSEMVKKSLSRLRRKAKTQPVGFELLPEKFTIQQLRSLYEAINGKIYDHRNFNKKIKSFTWIVKLDEKDKTSSKKGAFYYRFDKQLYEKFLEMGINFEI